MKNVFILSNAGIGISIAEQLQNISSDYNMCIVTNSVLPFDSSRLLEVLTDKTDFHGIALKPEAYFQERSLSLISELELTRINTSRKRLFFNDRSQREYDYLIIADLPQYRLPDIKGHNKNRIYSLKKQEDINSIRKKMRFSDVVTIEGDSILGFQLALAGANSKREVNLLISDDCVWSKNLTDQWGRFTDMWSKKGLQVWRGSVIQELLGDGDVKAVRLNSGKVLASDLVIFTKIIPDFRVFSDEEITITKSIQIDQGFKSIYDGVYVMGEFAVSAEILDQSINPEQLFKEQATGVARQILGQESEQAQEACINFVQWDNIKISWCGDSVKVEDLESELANTILTDSREVSS